MKFQSGLPLKRQWVKVKVLFIEPPYKSTIEHILGVHGPLLGLASMAHKLWQEGHDVEILDCPTLGLAIYHLKQIMQRLEPDPVGITLTTPSFSEARRVAKVVKDWNQSCPVVLGGPHVSSEDVPTLDNRVPGETLDDLWQNVSFARKLRPDYMQFTCCTPYLGTPLYEYSETSDLFLTRDWDHYTTMEQVMKVVGLDENELRTIFRDTYLSRILASLWKVLRKREFGLFKNILIRAGQTLLG